MAGAPHLPPVASSNGRRQKVNLCTTVHSLIMMRLCVMEISIREQIDDQIDASRSTRNGQDTQYMVVVGATSRPTSACLYIPPTNARV